MENSRKNLKQTSIVVLAFAALSLIRTMVQFFTGGFDVKNTEIQLAPELLEVVSILSFVFALVILLPQVYVGMKGMHIASSGEYSNGPVIVASILLATTLLSVVTSITSLAGGRDLVNDVLLVVDHVLDAIIYTLFIKYAKEVRREM